MGMISRHVEINSAVFTCACLFRMFVETHQPLFQKVIMHGKKTHVFKKIIVGVEKQVSVACEERHGDVTKIPALFVFLYSMILLEPPELDELGRLLYLGYLYLRSIANW